MPRSSNTSEIYKAKQELELEKIRREKEKRKAALRVIRPPAALQKIAFEALSRLIECQKNGKKENQADKKIVIDFLLAPAVTPAEKQEEVKALYQSIVDKFGPETWVPILYSNRESGRFYIPHHADEAQFVYTDGDTTLDGQPLETPWQNVLLKGGEGSGKSVGGIVKGLERLRRVMNGFIASPDLVHFKKSLWPEFKRWCPWQHVDPKQQYRGEEIWEPDKFFTLTFKNKAQALCGGMDEPLSWDGVNVSWAHLDEARRKKTPDALKVINGRIRIAGKHDEPPQAWFTTTPKKHWLFAYFGPWQRPGEVDPLAEFKLTALVITLKTYENEKAGNVAAGYTQKRAAALETAAERRVLLEAEWEDIDDVERFLSSIILWDACHDSGLKPLERWRPIIAGADAGVRNDYFAFVGITSHHRTGEAQIAFARVWKPQPGKALNFDLIESEIKNLCKLYNIILIGYDEFQLHQMMSGLKDKRVVETQKFSQQAERAKADKNLLDFITNRQLHHDGSQTELREALDNADRKIAGEDRSIRIVKREDGLKIDAAVACSMALWLWTNKKPAKAVKQQNYLHDDTDDQ